MSQGWNVMDALNGKAAAAAADNRPKARFRVKDISIRRMYSSDLNFYSMPDIEELAQEIYAVGLMENLVVAYDPTDKGEYRIIAGERRWRALCLLVDQGHEEFETASCQIKTPAEEHEEIVQLIIANAYRNKTVTDVLEEERRLKGALQYMKDNGLTLHGYTLDSGRLRDVIADIMQMPTTKIAQIESINKRLIPEFTEELKEGRLTFSAAYEISGLNEDMQKQLLERYQDNGLTFTEVREIKKQQEEEAKKAQLDGQMSLPEEITGSSEEGSAQDGQENAQEGQEGTETDEAEGEDHEGKNGAENGEEWQQAHPESITSLCYGCQRYSECNVRTSTCTSCDRYINKAEAEKTDEQRYNEEQDRIDRETAKKLAEMEREKKLDEHLAQSGVKVHDIKLGATFFDDVESGRKPFELRKNDRGYKVGDILRLMEFSDGRFTGRKTMKEVIYMLEDYTGLEDGFCIMGIRAYTEEKEAARDAANFADNPTTPNGQQSAAVENLQYGA